MYLNNNFLIKFVQIYQIITYIKYFFRDKTKLELQNTCQCTLEHLRNLINFFLLWNQVFAEENPEVNVLNYSPGPVDTDMLQTMTNTVGDKDTKASFKEMRDKNVILSTEQTVRRLCDVLLKKKYKSGDHVDYFDEIF